MKSIFTERLFFHCVLILLLAFNMASHSPQLWPGNDWYGRALYWGSRFSLETVLFLGVYYVISVFSAKFYLWLRLFLAFLISWPIFVLTITMLDIVLGHPELDGALHGDRNRLIAEIIDESMWILPKHLFFCCLVVLINFRVGFRELFDFRFNLLSDAEQSTKQEQAISGLDNFLGKISTKYREHPLRLQAQEHYIKVTTCLGTELVHYPFGQALNDLTQEKGLQVHRSYWVAMQNVLGWIQQKNNIQLELKFGDPVPVSRRFEQIVKAQFERIEEVHHA